MEEIHLLALPIKYLAMLDHLVFLKFYKYFFFYLGNTSGNAFGAQKPATELFSTAQPTQQLNTFNVPVQQNSIFGNNLQKPALMFNSTIGQPNSS